MSTHLTIKNENCPNPRTATPEKKALFSLVLVTGDMICFVVKSENLMKRGLWSRLGFKNWSSLSLGKFFKFQFFLKVDVPILPCVFYTFSWLNLISEMYFVRFHPEVTSCLLSRGKTMYATLGMRLWCKYINYLLVYQLISHFLPYLRNYKEFEGEILDLQLEKYGLSFETKKYTTSGWARGDENVIGIRAFKFNANFIYYFIKEVETTVSWILFMK